MILANGAVYDTAKQQALLDALPGALTRTLSGPPLPQGTVVEALDRAASLLEAGAYAELLPDVQLQGAVSLAARMLHREAVTYRLQTELPPLDAQVLPEGFTPHRRVYRPLGVLLHIAAGNMDVLPAYSVMEGLLTGNINLLKLPQADTGLTIRFFEAFLELAPELRDYIYVFDTPSTDLPAMQHLISVSDGIAVWGSDAAVSAVRQLAPPGCRLIEWGHKLGFCYISGYEDRTLELSQLAAHIAATQQLLCSSCQVIYLDTQDMVEVYDFCKAFLPVLDAACAGIRQSPGAAAQSTLRRYTAFLEHTMAPEREEPSVYRGRCSSLTACEDASLTLSGLYGNCLVKRLPSKDIVPVLRQTSRYLQTAGLICEASRRRALTESLLQSGVTRVMHAGDMSDTYLGEAHDGEYALRRYVRICDIS
ncbi:MAG: acyl-CoA reductase [Oscillospiraceae bacterium]|nr:acyl-CoA reductase [Oscillospiraceae bacterium]